MRISPIAQSYKNQYTPLRGDVSFGAFNYKKLDGLTYDKYKNLSLVDKLKFRLLTPLFMKRDVRMNYYAACHSCQYFDKLYGRDNYTLMIIGRSVASIGETIGLLGRDVKFLPMSAISDSLPESIEHIDVYRKYLASIGLTKEFIEKNPKRSFILMDFVSSGGTLENAHKFLSRSDLLGNPDRLQTISVQRAMGVDNLATSYLELLFMFSRFKTYSPISSLSLMQLDKTFEKLKPESGFEDKRNLFLFNIMRRIEKDR